MRIVVIGAGKVGGLLVEQLTREGHQVVVVDNNEKKLMAVAKLSSTLLIAPDRIPTNHTSFAC